MFRPGVSLVRTLSHGHGNPPLLFGNRMAVVLFSGHVIEGKGWSRSMLASARFMMGGGPLMNRIGIVKHVNLPTRRVRT